MKRKEANEIIDMFMAGKTAEEIVAETQKSPYDVNLIAEGYEYTKDILKKARNRKNNVKIIAQYLMAAGVSSIMLKPIFEIDWAIIATWEQRKNMPAWCRAVYDKRVKSEEKIRKEALKRCKCIKTGSGVTIYEGCSFWKEGA